MAPHDIDPEFHADDEHVERQAQLRRGEEVTLRIAHLLRGVPREKPMLPFRPEQPEERWPKQHARQHFRHDLRLPKAHGNRSNQSAKKENYGQLQKKLHGEMNVIHENRIRSTGSLATILVES